MRVAQADNEKIARGIGHLASLVDGISRVTPERRRISECS
jgi:hypothetical protein